MKGTTTIIISVLFIMFGFGLKTVIHKANGTTYVCTVNTIAHDGSQHMSTVKFDSERLEAIMDHGGAMLGVHVDELREQDGSFTAVIKNQEEALAGAVVCKKSVSF